MRSSTVSKRFNISVALPFLVAAVLQTSIVTHANAATQPNGVPGKIAVGEVVPNYLGIDRQNNKILASDYAGKVLVVTFWASWCGPCIKEMQVMENLQNAAKDRVKVVAINIEEREKYRAVARALSALTVTIAHDYTKSVSETFGVQGIPHMVIIGRDSRVLNVHRGYGDGMIPKLAAEINAALAAPKVEASASPVQN